MAVHILGKVPCGTAEKKCPGAASTIEGKVEATTLHNHYGDKSRVELKRMQGLVQKRARDSKDPPRTIIGNAIETVSDDTKPLIRRSLTARNIRKTRQVAQLEPANPKSLVHLKIPKEFKMLGMEVFMKYDGWNEDERMQIFTTDKCLDFMQGNSKWGADATFDPTPLLFGQLWILFVQLCHTFVPMVFVLMTQRKASSYAFVLQRLNEIRPGLKPSSIAVDFEKAEWNAFENFYSGISLRPCFFHLMKSIVRHVCENGGKVIYDASHEFRQEVNCIAALAFAPVKDVAEAFVELRELFEASENAELLENILDYFEDSYIGRLTGNKGKRKNPSYPIEKWNLRALVETDQPRTSNGIESFNGPLIRTLAASHPTIWKLIEGLRREFVIAEQRIGAHWAGAKEPRRGQTYVDIDRIKNTFSRYHQIPKIQFLRSIAINLGRIQVYKVPVIDEFGNLIYPLKAGGFFSLANIYEFLEILDHPSEKIVVKKFGIGLTQEHLECLGPEQKLKGEIINFYMQLIVDRSKVSFGVLSSVYAFDTLFHTQLIEKGPKLAQNWAKDVRIFDYDVILIPVHSGKLEDGHRSLMVAKPIKGRFLYLDSLHRDGDEQIKQIKHHHPLPNTWKSQIQQTRLRRNLICVFDTLFHTQLIEKGPKLAQNWAKDVRIFDYDVILIRVHSGKLEDGHRSLMVAKPIKGRFLYLDSLHRYGDEQIKQIKHFFAEFAEEKNVDEDPSNWLGLSPKDIPLQANSYDCGPFTCKFADSVARNVPINFTQGQMPQYREEMIREILKGKIL